MFQIRGIVHRSQVKNLTNWLSANPLNVKLWTLCLSELAGGVPLNWENYVCDQTGHLYRVGLACLPIFKNFQSVIDFSVCVRSGEQETSVLKLLRSKRKEPVGVLNVFVTISLGRNIPQFGRTDAFHLQTGCIMVATLRQDSLFWNELAPCRFLKAQCLLHVMKQSTRFLD